MIQKGIWDYSINEMTKHFFELFKNYSTWVRSIQMIFGEIRKWKGLNLILSRIHLMILWTYLIGHSNSNNNRIYIYLTLNHFSRAVRGENFLYVSKGGLADSIYPNEPSIESLQLMFGPEEREEICKKWGFMIQSKIKLI